MLMHTVVQCRLGSATKTLLCLSATPDVDTDTVGARLWKSVCQIVL